MKNFLFFLLRILGGPFLFRQFAQRNKVTIVLFHDISTAAAEKAFSYLSRKYNIISLDDFLSAVKHKKSLPKRALIITFDDGHIRNYDILPVIKRRNIPVTIFLCAAIANTRRHFWFMTSNPPVAVPELKTKTNADRLAILSEGGFFQDQECDAPQALQRAQIEEMKHLVNFQSHTLYHPILPSCDDEEARKEIFDSKEVLEREYDLEINALSYPNGNYSERDIMLAKEAGYTCGITVDFGFNTTSTDLFRLKRISVNDTNNINELIVKASGLWAFLRTRNGRKTGYQEPKNSFTR